MMKPRPHQVEGAKWALEIIRKYGLAYLTWQERTGKTLTALTCVENSLAKTCLIVTKKKAIEGWVDTLNSWKHTTNFVVINYESIHKRVNGKFIVKPEYLGFDFIILDEAHHAISGIGRPSSTWKSMRKITEGKAILYLSATPYAEHIGLIYHQLKLSKWTPLNDKNFYDFFRKYGVPSLTRTPYGLQETYKKYETDRVLARILHLFNFKTRAEVGIEHEPTINVVKVPMHPLTRDAMAQWTDNRLLNVGGHELLGDSDPKLRAVHYQLEGGTLKIDDQTSVFLSPHEKVDYIKANYETKEIAIMAHFVKERELLAKELPDALVLSSDGHAEGVDLSHKAKLVVYSMSFKTSKHTQRTARQANHNRQTPIEVDILVMDKPAVGMAVYESVAIKKENFIKDSYERATY